MASPLLKRIIRTVTDLHILLYKASRGKLANRVANLPLLLLTTYGRKSGKPRTSPVVYMQDSQDYVVVASAGGMDWHPDWYLNLQKKPPAKIQVEDKVLDVMATITTGDERTQLYERFKVASDSFVKYEKSTARVIPVVRLTPIKSGA